MDPPCIYRYGGSLDEEADDEEDDRFLSQGMRELGSVIGFPLAA